MGVSMILWLWCVQWEGAQALPKMTRFCVVDWVQVKGIITAFLDTIPNNKKEEVRG